MSKENFKSWVRTVTGLVTDDGTAHVFDHRAEKVYEELRTMCESEKWIPTGVTQSFSTQTNGTDILCVMVITAQLVSQEYAETQQRSEMIKQNGFRR